MLVDGRQFIWAAALFALAGTAMLFLFSESAQRASVAEALVAPENSLLAVSGTAQNVSRGKFYLCDRVCIRVRTAGLPSAELLQNGREVSVVGRAHSYMNNAYLVAEKIEIR